MHYFVICVDNSDYKASLETRKIYERILDSEAEKKGFMRVVDESGDDFLFPKSLFLEISLSDAVANRVAAIL